MTQTKSRAFDSAPRFLFIAVGLLVANEAAHFLWHLRKPNEQLDEVLAELRQICERLVSGQPDCNSLTQHHSALRDTDHLRQFNSYWLLASTIAKCFHATTSSATR